MTANRFLSCCAFFFLLAPPYFVSFSPDARADGDSSACSVPICDVKAKVDELMSLGEGGRYDMLSEYLALVTPELEAKSLKNLAEFGNQAESALRAASAEGYLVTMAGNISGNSYAMLVVSDTSTADDRIYYYGLLTSENIRYNALSHWQEADLDALAGLSELRELNRFFFAAIELSHDPATPDSQNWVLSAAAQRADRTGTRMLTDFDLHMPDAERVVHSLYFGQTRWQFAVDVLAAVNDGSIEIGRLPFYLALMKFAYSDSVGKYEEWVPVATQGTVNAIAGRLILDGNRSAEEMKSYYASLKGDSQRFDFMLNQLRPKVLDFTRVEDVLRYLDFLSGAYLLSHSDETPDNQNWVMGIVRSVSNELAGYAIKTLPMKLEEAQAVFHTMTSVDARVALCMGMIPLADARPDDSEYLDYLVRFLLFSFEDSKPYGPEAQSGSELALQHVLVLILKQPLPPDAGRLAKYFVLLPRDEVRSEILTYWKARLGRIHDEKEILELGTFFKFATEHGQSHGFQNWVVYKAIAGEEAVTQKLSRFFPVFEGIYEVQSTNPELDRVVIVDSRSSDGLQVLLGSSKFGSEGLAFPAVELHRSASWLDGTAQVHGGLTALHIELDHEKRTIRGHVYGAPQGGVVSFAGGQLGSTARAFEDRAAAGSGPASTSPDEIPLDAVTGRWKGSLDDGQTEISLQSLVLGDPAKGEITGVIRLKNAQHPAGLPTYFDAGYYDAGNASLQLVSNGDSGERVKIVIAFSRAPSDHRLIGRAALITSRFAPVEFFNLEQDDRK